MTELWRAPPTSTQYPGLPKPQIRRVTGIHIQSIPTGDILPPEPDESVQGIQCINCLDRIDEEVFIIHSRSCVAHKKIDINSANALWNINNNISKFKEYLESLLESSNEAPSESNTLNILVKKCQGFLAVTGAPHYESSSELTNSISSLAVNTRGALSTRLYIERLFSLGKEQGAILQNLILEARKQKMRNFQSGVLKLRQKNDRTQKKALFSGMNLLKFSMARLEEINSEVNSKMSSGMFSESSVAVPCHSESEFWDPTVKTEDFQRYFYSLCISVKLKFPKNDPAQVVPVSKLYAAAKQKEIAQENWTGFIEEQLRDPANWANQRNRRVRQNQPRREFRYFEAITEED